MQLDQTLQARMNHRRLAHAYLLTGRDRRELADTLAAALVCTGDAPPCMACTACRSCGTGSFRSSMRTGTRTPSGRSSAGSNRRPFKMSGRKRRTYRDWRRCGA